MKGIEEMYHHQLQSTKEEHVTQTRGDKSRASHLEEKTIFSHSLSNKGRHKMALSQGALCVLLAGRMKDEGLWSWRSAPEMPTEPARRCHTNQHMLYTYLGGMNLSQKFFSMAFHPPFAFFNWKL